MSKNNKILFIKSIIKLLEHFRFIIFDLKDKWDIKKGLKFISNRNSIISIQNSSNLIFYKKYYLLNSKFSLFLINKISPDNNL